MLESRQMIPQEQSIATSGDCYCHHFDRACLSNIQVKALPLQTDAESHDQGFTVGHRRNGRRNHLKARDTTSAKLYIDACTLAAYV